MMTDGNKRRLELAKTTFASALVENGVAVTTQSEFNAVCKFKRDMEESWNIMMDAMDK